MADNTAGKDLSTEVLNPMRGKEIGGHPFFEVDIENLIRQEIKMGNPDIADAELETRARTKFANGGYKDIKVPTYNSNNGVDLVLEPDENTDEGFRAYISAYPSEKQFQQLKKTNESFNRYHTAGEYRNAVANKFALPINVKILGSGLYIDGVKYWAPNEGDMYERGSMFIPFSQHGITDAGIQTPLSAMVDKMVAQMSSKND